MRSCPVCADFKLFESVGWIHRKDDIYSVFMKCPDCGHLTGNNVELDPPLITEENMGGINLSGVEPYQSAEWEDATTLSFKVPVLNEKEIGGLRGETRCRVCGRLLTAPESVKRGIGPVCLRHLLNAQARAGIRVAEVDIKADYAVLAAPGSFPEGEIDHDRVAKIVNIEEKEQ